MIPLKKCRNCHRGVEGKKGVPQTAWFQRVFFNWMDFVKRVQRGRVCQRSWTVHSLTNSNKTVGQGIILYEKNRTSYLFLLIFVEWSMKLMILNYKLMVSVVIMLMSGHYRTRWSDLQTCGHNWRIAQRVRSSSARPAELGRQGVDHFFKVSDFGLVADVQLMNLVVLVFDFVAVLGDGFPVAFSPGGWLCLFHLENLYFCLDQHWETGVRLGFRGIGDQQRGEWECEWLFSKFESRKWVYVVRDGRLRRWMWWDDGREKAEDEDYDGRGGRRRGREREKLNRRWMASSQIWGCSKLSRRSVGQINCDTYDLCKSCCNIEQFQIDRFR